MFVSGNLSLTIEKDLSELRQKNSEYLFSTKVTKGSWLGRKHEWVVLCQRNLNVMYFQSARRENIIVKGFDAKIVKTTFIYKKESMLSRIFIFIYVNAEFLPYDNEIWYSDKYKSVLLETTFSFSLVLRIQNLILYFKTEYWNLLIYFFKTTLYVLNF